MTEQEKLIAERLKAVKSESIWGLNIQRIMSSNPSESEVLELIAALRSQYQDDAHVMTQILGFNLEHPEI